MRMYSQHVVRPLDADFKKTMYGPELRETQPYVSVDSNDGTVRITTAVGLVKFSEADWLAVRDACEALRKEAGRP